MLNKELLMGASNEQRPVMVTVASFVDTGDVTNIGYSRQFFNMGKVDPIPYWVSERFEYLYLKYLQSKYPVQFDKSASFAGKGVYPFQEWEGATDFTGIVTRSDTEKSVAFIEGSAYEHLFTEDDIGKTIPIYFTPPPRRILGSRNTLTDLRRGYYVEEAPWEAQNAEQGTSDARRLLH